MCKIFHITRQAYYKHCKQATTEMMDEQIICDLVQEIRRQLPRLGGKKLYHLLYDHLKQVGIGRDKFFAVLRNGGLLVPRRGNRVITTLSHHRFFVYKNLISGKKITGPDQVYVSDITYLRTRKGFVYLFLITDAYSRKIVGWSLCDSLSIEGAIKALQMALKQSTRKRGRIHHSDRGFQYCGRRYTALLRKNNIAISMAASGDVYENALAERVNGILKDEFSLDATWADLGQARKATRQAIKAYNHYRPHLSLKMKTPAQVHSAA